MAEMPFVSSLVQEDLPVWQQCLDTEFLRRMEDGTLDEACFKGYIVEDSLYLREYAMIITMHLSGNIPLLASFLASHNNTLIPLRICLPRLSSCHFGWAERLTRGRQL